MLTPNAIRQIILEQSKRAHVGHIGSALSITEIITALYRDVLNIPDPNADDRDRFVLSKGHAALALYAVLYLKGWITQEQLDTFCGNDSQLGVHPEHFLNGIDFSSGSLGHGLSIGAGAALAAKIRDATYRVYVLISDAECNEGSIWEAAQFAAQHRLTNLVTILDFNRQQAFGYTKDVLNQDNVAERWQAFGWHTISVDGHDTAALTAAMQPNAEEKPTLVIANTTFGKGVSYMENQIKWHYFPMNDEEYAQARQENEF